MHPHWKSLAVPQNETEFPQDLAIPCLGMYLRETETPVYEKGRTHVHSSAILSQKVERAPMSSN